MKTIEGFLVEMLFRREAKLNVKSKLAQFLSCQFQAMRYKNKFYSSSGFKILLLKNDYFLKWKKVPILIVSYENAVHNYSYSVNNITRRSCLLYLFFKDDGETTPKYDVEK